MWPPWAGGWSDREFPRGEAPPNSSQAQDPLQRPKKTKKSPAPAFHAASKAVRLELRDAYAWFVAAYREAAAKLSSGDRNVAFPRGCFPPRLPFVAA